MRFAEENALSKFIIKAYSTHSVTVNEEEYTQNIILSSHKGVRPLECKKVDQLSTEILRPLLLEQPDMLLIGTGKYHMMIHPELVAFLASYKVGIENMDTKAACRTFNLLANEDRNVIALLFVSV